MIAGQIIIKHHSNIIDTLYTNFDGIAKNPSKAHFGLEISSIGLESVNTYIHGKLDKDIKVDLKQICGSRTVIKGVKKEFRINELKGLVIDLVEINEEENTLIVR